jgi:hypothetical protein
MKGCDVLRMSVGPLHGDDAEGERNHGATVLQGTVKVCESQ